MDIAGIDVLAHVARNLAERLDSPEDRGDVRRCRRWSRRWSSAGWIGAKAGQGFYKKAARRRNPDARSGHDGVPRRSSRRGFRRSTRRARSRTSASASGRSSRATTRSGGSCARRSCPRSTTPNASRPQIAHELAPTSTRDALGFRLGARPVRDDCAYSSARRAPRARPARSAAAERSSRRMPARAWSTSATASSASSSTRR